MSDCLPLCTFRRASIGRDNYECQCPSLVLDASGVSGQFCRDACRYHTRSNSRHADVSTVHAEAGRIRMVRSREHTIGLGYHLSGWPYAVAALDSLLSHQGVLFDDFVEQTFCYNPAPQPYNDAWIGVFHHPPNMPPFSQVRERPEEFVRHPAWRMSLRHLLGGIALSQHSADYWTNQLGRPIHVVKHPTAEPVSEWAWSNFESAVPRRLVQVGHYLRNTQAIYQVPDTPGLQRMRLLSPTTWVRSWDVAVQEHWNGLGTRGIYAGVIEQDHLSANQYHELLTSSVVLTELFAASANNVVVECIARATPLIVNRHPAVVEYLGSDYPLFFDDIRQVPSLLTDDQILAAHLHIKRLDRSWLVGEAFCRSVRVAVKKLCE